MIFGSENHLIYIQTTFFNLLKEVKEMGEKTGGMTNAIIALVALVAIILVVQVAFPEMMETITGGMSNIISDSVSQVGGDAVGSGE